ncbi:translation elongation factor Ts [Patescibacteria group bacterium]|nr:translation elongation factor Ts [Patescibacteria group bacterium]MBU1952016.1 translation elongation factor Ts [Patescibacteria group bacterium]
MSEVTLELIKELREKTGAGVMDAKEMLKEAEGDIEKAIELLRKKGDKIALKKQSREAKEGVISFAEEGNKLAVVELYCETDFVARNEDFIASADALAKKLLADGPDTFKSWAQDELKNNLIVKVGENLQLGTFEIIEGEFVGSYLHTNKKVASVVVMSADDKELAHNIAMQIAAMNPPYLSPTDVPEEEKNKEMEIYKEQLVAENKPENVMEKIVEGKMQKYYSEVCLLKQPYFQEDKKTIEDLIKESSDKLGKELEISKFVRYSL